MFADSHKIKRALPKLYFFQIMQSVLRPIRMAKSHASIRAEVNQSIKLTITKHGCGVRSHG